MKTAISMGVRQACKTHGAALPWVLVQKLLARYFKTATVIIYRRGLRDSVPLVSRPVPTVRVARIDDAGSPLFRSLCDHFPHCDFESRMQREGRQCYVALRDNRIAGYAWVASTSLYIDEIACQYPVDSREIFIFDCHVYSEYRGAGIYPFMLDTMLLDCRERIKSAERACIASTSVNRASIRGIRKAGFVETNRVRYLEWGGRRHWWGVNAAANQRPD